MPTAETTTSADRTRGKLRYKLCVHRAIRLHSTLAFPTSFSVVYREAETVSSRRVFRGSGALAQVESTRSRQ